MSGGPPRPVLFDPGDRAAVPLRRDVIPIRPDVAREAMAVEALRRKFLARIARPGLRIAGEGRR
jgi:hypothetical protein